MELTDENQQLLSQYEKEKQQKKEIEEVMIEIQYNNIDCQHDLESNAARRKQ